MIKGIGVDIVELKRIKYKIASKVLSSKEKEVFDSFKDDKRKKEYLAGRFAAKEALFKATNESFDFKDISVLNDKSGKPLISYKNAHVSISHDGDYVIAFVVVYE